MTKAPVFIFILIFIMSCGLDKEYSGTRKPSALFANTLFAGGKPLNDEEMGIAVRICFAYRAKRNSYSSVIMGDQFFFKVTELGCGSTARVEKNTNSTLASAGAGMFFKTNYSGEFYSLVETDITGFLAPICSKVIQGETPMNYYEQNGEAFEVEFGSGVRDSYTVRIGQKESINDSDYKVVKTYIFDVVTNQAGSGKLNGLTSKVTRYKSCPGDTNNFDSNTREYVEP